MKKYLYLLGISFTSLLFALCSDVKESKIPKENVIESSEMSDRILTLSERVDIVNYVDNVYLDDGDLDDESRIIYTDESTVGDKFTVSEFTRYDEKPTAETVRKIKTIHIPELEKVRDNINEPIIIRSASRSKEHEISMGRAGKSQHVYANGKGAVDVSLVDYSSNKLNKLENAILDNTNYNRITRYNTFIHLDFASNRDSGRGYYRNTKYGWIYIGKVL